MKNPVAIRQLLGDNVRTLRKVRGWSQEELGEHADLSYKFVGEIERGTGNPSLDSLVGIANALTVPIAELFLHRGLLVLSDTDVADVETSMAVLNRVLGNARADIPQRQKA
ncbi:MAG: helix-turn-helix DNA-binding protein, XRE family [uncultured bacterium]|uniref:Helix-turn-helix DNA-binding protein, XRE family n=1 Tax=Citrifermentans bemidjiense (strain ATCC BAA-1014 / DSM 16622 / JCM 12645 / Bem) TaxID=404380 RepID=B5E9S1_CITBB|nr:helix-turn-helix DNA-binding protein, XRE family [Citrifermentans bemidjiense Bem]EKD59085.1 MAG: helix-turn-helix DNA-binding protein, XRE family [uncultured bacterium]